MSMLSPSIAARGVGAYTGGQAGAPAAGPPRAKIVRPGYARPGSLVPGAPQAPGAQDPGLRGNVNAAMAGGYKPPQQYQPGGVGGYQPYERRTMIGPQGYPQVAPTPARQPQQPAAPQSQPNTGIAYGDPYGSRAPQYPQYEPQQGSVGGQQQQAPRASVSGQLQGRYAPGTQAPVAPEPGPNQYRSPDGSIHDFPPGYVPEDLPGPVGEGDYKYLKSRDETKARGGAMTLEQIQAAAGNQGYRLGPEIAEQLGLGRNGGTPITYGEVGLAQIGEYARQERLGNQDLAQGVDYLQAGRSQIGTDQGSMTAMDIALRRALEGGQFTDSYLDQQRGAIRNRGAAASQSAMRRQEEDQARRGVSGSLADLNNAELQQQNALGVQGQLADFEQQAAAAREEAERVSLGQLNDMSYQQQQSKAAFDQALANAYLQNERAAIDYSPMLIRPKKAKNLVGGKKADARSFGRG